ncbi:hypothetical protein MANI_024592 [Metarhizium anisopliae]
MKASQWLTLCVLGVGAGSAVPSIASHGLDADVAVIDSAAVGISEQNTPNILKRQSSPVPQTISAEKAAKIASRGGQSGIFYRGDSRPPSEIFKTGFAPQGADKSLQRHLNFAGDSGYVSLTRSVTTAEKYAFGRSAAQNKIGYIYVVAPVNVPDGYWIPGIYTKDPAVRFNQEFAVGGAVKGSSISHVYQVSRDDPSKWLKKIKNQDYELRSLPRCIIMKRAICDPVKSMQEHGFRVPGQGGDAPGNTGPGEKAKPGKGGLEGEGVKSPSSAGKDAATPKQAEMAKRANTISAQEFDQSVKRLRGVPQAWVEKGVASFQDARTKILKYTPLEPGSPRLRVGSGGVKASNGMLIKGGGAVGGALWVTGVVYAFVTNSTTLDRAAALTAIIPFIGCAVNAAAALEKDEKVELVVLDAVLCNIADVLLFGPLAPVGVAIHVFRAIKAFFHAPPTAPTHEEMEQRRDDAWRQWLKSVFAYIYSHPYTYSEQSFALKLESTLNIDALSVLSEAAESIGALNASSSADLYDAASDGELDLAMLETGSREAMEAIRADQWKVIARRQRDYLLGIPDKFTNGTAMSLKETAERFNRQFVQDINSQEFFDNYPDQSLAEDVFDSVVSDTLQPVDRHSIVREKMNKAGEYLLTRPLPLPRALDVAFVLGQSKGIKFVQPDALAPSSFFDTEIREASLVSISQTYQYHVLIRHTLQVAQYIQGTLQENQFNNALFPVDNAELLQRLRLLIAMKLGKLYEDAKMDMLGKKYKADAVDLSPTPAPLFINPYIPPISAHPNNHLLVGLVLGLADAVSDKALGEKMTMDLEKESHHVRRQNWEELQRKFYKLRMAAMKISRVPTAKPRVPREFIDKHQPACVKLWAREELCEYAVSHCYYADNTSDEFVAKCLHKTHGEVQWVHEQALSGRRDLCAKFASINDCSNALRGCAREYPNSNFVVLYECAARAIPRQNH